jgi:hypothetical protein
MELSEARSECESDTMQAFPNADGGSTMPLLFRLLKMSPKIARAFLDLMAGIALGAQVFVGEDNLKAFQKWLWGTPQEQQQVLQQQPALSKEVEALFVVFQQHMDTQYQVNILAGYVLTLPALPEEGF